MIKHSFMAETLGYGSTIAIPDHTPTPDPKYPQTIMDQLRCPCVNEYPNKHRLGNGLRLFIPSLVLSF